MQAPDSDAALSESLMKETAFYDTSGERIRSGSENRWRNGVHWTRMQAWFRVLFGHYIGEMCSSTSSRLGDCTITDPGQSAYIYHQSEGLKNMSKRENKKKTTNQSKRKSFKIINPNAAGIDVGSEDHWIAVPEDSDEQPVRSFKCFTADLNAMSDWLKECA